MTSELSHEEMSALAIEKICEIGKTYGKLIFQKLLMFDLQLPELEAGVDAAVEDVRTYLTANMADPNDIELSLYHLRLSIIQEGRRLAEMLPEHETRTVQ